MNNINAGKGFIIKIIDSIGKLVFFRLAKRSSPLPDSEVRKILIIELWGIGDLVMMSSVLEGVKRLFPQAKINLLSKPVAADLFKADLFDEIIGFDFPWTAFSGKYRFWRWDWRGLSAVVKKIRKERFDLVLDARGDFRNNLISFLSGAKRRVGYDWTGGGYFLTDTAELDSKDKHRIDAWINLIVYLGLKSDTYEPRIRVCKEEEAWARDFLSARGIKEGDLLIGVHPGCRIKTRCWPLDNFGRVSEHIRDAYQAKILVFVEPEGYGEDIPIKGEYVKVRVSLRQMISLMRNVRLLICNDGGPMHMAAAVGTPVIAVFGPTNPVWFGPCGRNNKIIIKNDVKCRPCFDYCKYKEPFCIRDISPEDVLKEVSLWLKEYA